MQAIARTAKTITQTVGMTGTAVEVEGVLQTAIAIQRTGITLEEPIKVKEIAKTEVTIRVTLVIAQPLVRDKRFVIVAYPTCIERKER